MRGRAGGDRDRRPGLEELGGLPGDRVLGGPLLTGFDLEPGLVGTALSGKGRAAVDLLHQPAPGERVEVAPHGHVRHPEQLGEIADADAPVALDLLQDPLLPLGWQHGHASRLRRRRQNRTWFHHNSTYHHGPASRLPDRRRPTAPGHKLRGPPHCHALLRMAMERLASSGAMGRILVTRHLPPGGLDPLAGHELVQRGRDLPFAHDELVAAVATVDAVVCLLTDRIDAEVIAAAPRLRAIGNVAVGFDNVDLGAAARAGVAVCNTPGVLDETTADVAFGLVLAASRLFGEAERDLRAGRWHGWGINQYLGRAVARRASGFGMRVLHHARTSTGEPGYVGSLDELLAGADVVSLHVPLSAATRHLIGRRELDLMKPSAVLVNTA